MSTAHQCYASASDLTSLSVVSGYCLRLTTLKHLTSHSSWTESQIEGNRVVPTTSSIIERVDLVGRPPTASLGGLRLQSTFVPADS